MKKEIAGVKAVEGWQTKVTQSRVLFAAIHSHATNSNCFPGSNCEILKAKAPSFYEYQLLNILKNKVVSWVVNYDPPPPHQSGPLLGIHSLVGGETFSESERFSESTFEPCALSTSSLLLWAVVPTSSTRVLSSSQTHSDTTGVRSNSDRWMDSVCRSLPRNALHV